MRVKSLALAALAVASGCEGAPEAPRAAMLREAQAPRTLGLMTSLPILWGEQESFGAVLAGGKPPGWVRETLGERFTLEPLDALDAENLAELRLLVLAQPRALSPQENVALDDWVRKGGRVLIFADPLLTAHSRYPVGDRRRPQDVVLLSPLLTHWGLALSFDEDQPEGEREITVASGPVPVDQAGQLTPLDGAQCELSGAGLLARCSIDQGRATILADAALLGEEDHTDPAPRKRALTALLDVAFD